MVIKSAGIATFRTSASGELLAVAAEELGWDAVGGDERQMGSETVHEAQAELISKEGRTYEVSWQASEYPEGVLNHVTSDHPGLRMETDISVTFEHEPED